MNGPVAFLIDADNLSDTDAIRQAFEQLVMLAGPVTVRRAYGSAENMKGIATAIKDLAIQPYLTFPLSKNTTDSALVADAMELACEYRPACMAIGSGDLDFYPLAVRLRERGIRTVCFSLPNKLHEEVRAAYDQHFIVGKPTRRAGTTAVPAARAAVAVPVKAAAKKAPAKKAAATSASAKTAPTKKLAAAGNGPREATLGQILDAVPALRDGQAVSLTGAGKLLRDAGRLSKNGASPALFKHFPDDFELSPPGKQPTHVRWKLAPR